MKTKISAKEFWYEKFGEYPQNDTEKLAVAMMQEYYKQTTQQTEKMTLEDIMKIQFKVGKNNQITATITEELADFLRKEKVLSKYIKNTKASHKEDINIADFTIERVSQGFLWEVEEESPEGSYFWSKLDNKFRKQLKRIKLFSISDVSGSLACPNCGAELQLEAKEMTNSDLLKALKANDS